jgi:hypothetical protein
MGVYETFKTEGKRKDRSVMILLGGEWVLENEDDGVAAQEHLADESILQLKNFVKYISAKRV